MASKSWFCYDRNCRKPLGSIVNGELSISPLNNQNIQIITTEGAILNVQCSNCGRICRWVPKDSALVEAFMNTHLMRSLIVVVGKLFKVGSSQAEIEEKQEEIEEPEE
jgi:hypothetical protein